MRKANRANIGSGPKYPQVKMQAMAVNDGFAPAVVAVQAAMRHAGIPRQELSNFYLDAAESGQDNLLRTCLEWVDVELG
jgi:formyltetrahydrofolate synthetase